MPSIQVRTITDIEQAMAQTYAGMPGADYNAKLQPGEYDPSAVDIAIRKHEACKRLTRLVVERGDHAFYENHTIIGSPGTTMSKQGELKFGQAWLGSMITVAVGAEIQTPHGVIRSANAGRRQLLGMVELHAWDKLRSVPTPMHEMVKRGDFRGLRVFTHFYAQGSDDMPNIPKLIQEDTDPQTVIASKHLLGVSFEGKPQDEPRVEGLGLVRLGDHAFPSKSPKVVRRARLERFPADPSTVPQAGDEAFKEFVAASLTLDVLEAIAEQV